MLAGCVSSQVGYRLLFLSPLNAPQIWSVGVDGADPRRLTSSADLVYDFAVWPDGSRLVYALSNELGGLDLWLASADGRRPWMLLACGADRCAEAAVSPDGRRIAYTRRNASENPGGDPGLPRLWLIDPAAGTTRALYSDARIACTLPSWSPDAARLACYDPRMGGLRIHRMDSETPQQDLLLENAYPQSAAWTPDSAAVLYSVTDTTGGTAVARLARGDVRDGAVTLLLPDLAALDLGQPALSPDGKRLAVSLLLPGEGGGRDLWLADLDNEGGGILRPLEEEALTSTTACRWSPDGRLLACQEFDAGQSSHPPRVVVWDPDSRRRTVLAEEGALPRWIP